MAAYDKIKAHQGPPNCSRLWRKQPAKHMGEGM